MFGLAGKFYFIIFLPKKIAKPIASLLRLDSLINNSYN